MITKMVKFHTLPVPRKYPMSFKQKVFDSYFRNARSTGLKHINANHNNSNYRYNGKRNKRYRNKRSDNFLCTFIFFCVSPSYRGKGHSFFRYPLRTRQNLRPIGHPLDDFFLLFFLTVTLIFAFTLPSTVVMVIVALPFFLCLDNTLFC